MNDRLTQRQEEVLGAVQGYIEANGWAPSIREICEIVGAKHPQSVDSVLDCLERKEFVRRGGGARALAVTSKGRIRLKATGLHLIVRGMESPEALADFATELYVDKQRLEADLAEKAEAVCVQTAMQRVLSKRAERLESQIKQLRIRLQILGDQGGGH